MDLDCYLIVSYSIKNASCTNLGAFLFALSPLPGRNLPRIAPQSAALFTCFGLGLPVARLDVGRRLTNIALKYPGHATVQLLEIRIDTIDENYCQYAAVSIQAVSVQLHIATEYEIAQVLFGSLAERL
jgi:hypothetical protein